MALLHLTVAGTEPTSGAERVFGERRLELLWNSEADATFSKTIADLLREAAGAVDASARLEALVPWQVQVGVGLSAPITENARPAFHLEASALIDMGRSGARFDFDPYCPEHCGCPGCVCGE